MIIYAATTNSGKLREFCRILQPLGFTVYPATRICPIPEIPETGTTFAANAVQKAMTVATFIGQPVLADDSGLEVNALAGEPGVHSARYAGAGATDADRVLLLLSRLTERADRSARFVCVVAIALPGRLIGTAEGEVRGTISQEAIGRGGFGYDPIFIPENHTKTFAELGSDIKDTFSHRGRALRAAADRGLLQMAETRGSGSLVGPGSRSSGE